MKKIKILIGILCLLIFTFNSLSAGTVNEKRIKEVKALVNKAVDFLAKGGDINKLSDKNNKEFVKGTLYVFVYNCKDKKVILEAHPYLAGKLVGKNVATIKDKRGKFLCLSLCRAVKEHPEGYWDSYYWINPKTKILEEKFTYIKQVPGKSYQVAAGAYKSELGDVSLDLLNAKYK